MLISIHEHKILIEHHHCLESIYGIPLNSSPHLIFNMPLYWILITSNGRLGRSSSIAQLNGF